MKKGVKVIAVSAVISIVVLLSGSIYRKAKAKDIIDKNTATMPSFTFTGLNNSPFSGPYAVSKYGRTIINYFDPDCEHCQYMVKNYFLKADKLKDVQIIMVTHADSTSTIKFVTKYGLNDLHNIMVLRDTKYEFEKIFGPAIVPSFFIYQNNKLVKKIMGETIIENLLS